VNEKNEELVKELTFILLTLTGCPEDSKNKSSFKVFKSVTGYLFETIKALEKENRFKFYSKK
jgi:hypothetical protein